MPRSISRLEGCLPSSESGGSVSSPHYLQTRGRPGSAAPPSHSMALRAGMAPDFTSCSPTAPSSGLNTRGTNCAEVTLFSTPAPQGYIVGQTFLSVLPVDRQECLS